MSDDDEYVPDSTLGLDAATFATRYPHAVLLIEEPTAPPETSKFRTLAGEAQGELPPHSRKGRLVRVRKRGGNPFAMMITIGRAPNNDIVIPGNDISKFHAFLCQQGTEWTISDGGSTNGTFVEGEQLPVRAPRSLRPGTVVTLGATPVTLLQGQELYHYLAGASEGASKW